MDNILKEYLVRLGADVDTSSFKEFTGALTSANKEVGSFVGQLVKGSGAAIGALSALNGAITGLVVNTAKQDLAMQKYARSMMISTKTAYEMKSALDALGESAADIQNNSELRNQYNQLVADSRAIGFGEDFSDMQRSVRDVMFEFTRLKQSTSYFFKWISYYIVKDFIGPLSKGKETLESINKTFIKDIPKLSRTVADGLGYVVNMMLNGYRAVKATGTAFLNVWDRLSDRSKGLLKIVTLLSVAWKMLPFGKWAKIITGVLLLLDDFFGYIDGKDAALGPIWDKVIDVLADVQVALIAGADAFSDFVDGFKESDGFNEFIRLCKESAKIGGQLFDVYKDMATDALGALWTKFKDKKVPQEFTALIKELGYAVSSLWSGVNNCVSAFTDLLKYLTGDASVMPFWNGVGDLFTAFNKKLIATLGTLGRIGRIIGLLMQGDFAKASALVGAPLGVDSPAPEDALGYIDELVNVHGVDKTVAVAAVANMGVESNWNPNAYNPDDDGAESYGLAQWRGGRFDDLKQWCQANGYDYTTARGQLAYMAHEFKTTEKQAYQKTLGATNFADATKIYMDSYERPNEDPNINHIEDRLFYANDLAKRYNTQSKNISTKNDYNMAVNSGENGIWKTIKQQFTGMADILGGWLPSNQAAPSYAMAGGNYSSSATTSVGDIVINVAKTNASPEDIANATVNGIRTAGGMKARSIVPIRNMRGGIA